MPIFASKTKPNNLKKKKVLKKVHLIPHSRQQAAGTTKYTHKSS